MTSWLPKKSDLPSRSTILHKFNRCSRNREIKLLRH